MESARWSLLLALIVLALTYAIFWAATLTRRKQWSMPSALQMVIGLVTDFLDTLGIGSFAITTALYRFFKVVDDRLIPGTLNVGHGLPTVTQALIFIAAIQVDIKTLWLLILSSMLGAWMGARLVARLPKRAVQFGMGCALLLAGGLLLVKMMEVVPKEGNIIGLDGWKLMVGLAGNFVFGALMTIGVGAYAPIMVMVSLLGMNPETAFPIMMGSCAFLMPTASSEFIRKDSYDCRAALGLTLLGIPGVILAFLLVKSLNLSTINYLVLLVVGYTAITMLVSATRPVPSSEPRVA